MRSVRKIAAAIALTLAALWVSPGAAAQAARKLPTIAVLAERADPDPMLAAFLDGLRDLGYAEGKDVIVEKRFGQGAVERYPELVAELIRLQPDVLVVGGGVAARAAIAANRTIPIVFATVGDPVALGLAASLARPGGIATGLSNVSVELGGKQLDLLKAAAPRTSRVAILHNPLNSGPALDAARKAARALAIEVVALEVRRASDLAPAVAAAVSRRADALLALSDPVIGNALPQLVRLTTANRLPAIYSRSEFAQDGGLMAYGPSFATNYRRAASYVDRILKGAKPGELAIEQPTTFELVVNRKTAKALGLEIAPSLLQRADRVVE